MVINLHFKKGDLLILFLILIAGLAWLTQDYIWPETDQKLAIIEMDGQIYKKLILNQDQLPKKIILDISDNKYLHIVSEKGGIKVEDSTCPNQICVKTGIITKTGQNIVCLPYKVVIYIEGAAANKIDDVTY